MGIYYMYTVVVVVIALLVNLDTLSTCVLAQVTTKSSHWTHSTMRDAINNIIDKRSLRVDNSGDGRGDTEERVGNIFSKVSNFFKNNNAIRWADAAKSDDFVKKKFKLTGLSGVALTGHKNYKHFEKFVEIKTSNQLDAWLKADKSTVAVWRELGLGSINTWDDLMNAAHTDAFKIYQRYADSFDNNAVINAAFKGKPIPVWSSDTSWTERIARMVSWKANKKGEKHIMLMLGFNTFSLDALEANQNAKTYLIYWLLKHDDSLNAAQPDIKDILKRLMELENLPSTELTKLRNVPSLNEARHDTNNLLKKLFGLEKLSSAQIARTDNIQTYKYLYGILVMKPKQQKIDEQVSTFVNPRLR